MSSRSHRPSPNAFSSPAKRIWPSFHQIWSSNPKMVLKMLWLGFQGPKMHFSRLGKNTFRVVSALLVFLVPVSEPKSRSRSLGPSPNAPAKCIWPWYRQICSSMQMLLLHTPTYRKCSHPETARISSGAPTKPNAFSKAC